MRFALGIPTIKDPCSQTHSRNILLGFEIHKMGYDLMVETPSGLVPHDQARTAIVDAAVKFGAARLFFLDNDILLPLGGLQRLTKTMEESKAVVVSGHYLRRGYPYTCVWSVRDNLQIWHQCDCKKGWVPIHSSGLGCALIDLRWITDHLDFPYFEMNKDEEGLTKITDDITFFQKILDKGGLVVGDAEVRCKHVGEPVLVDEGTAHWLRYQYLTGRPFVDYLKMKGSEDGLPTQNSQPGSDGKEDIQTHGDEADEQLSKSSSPIT